MIDYDDVDDVAWLSLFFDGPIALIILVIAIGLIIFAYSNDNDCQKKSCNYGQTPRLMDHSCLCISEAK